MNMYFGHFLQVLRMVHRETASATEPNRPKTLRGRLAVKNEHCYQWSRYPSYQDMQHNATQGAWIGGTRQGKVESLKGLGLFRIRDWREQLKACIFNKVGLLSLDDKMLEESSARAASQNVNSMPCTVTNPVYQESNAFCYSTSCLMHTLRIFRLTGLSYNLVDGRKTKAVVIAVPKTFCSLRPQSHESLSLRTISVWFKGTKTPTGALPLDNTE